MGNTTPDPAPKKSSAKPPLDAFKEAAESVFAQVKNKMNLSPEAVDAWQKKWLSLPEVRRKYEHLNDVPFVAAEEMLAMANDVIDFAQSQQGGKSWIFQKVREGAETLKKDPMGTLKTVAAEGKQLASRGMEAVRHLKDTLAREKAAAAQEAATVQAPPAPAAKPAKAPAKKPTAKPAAKAPAKTPKSPKAAPARKK